MAASRGLEQLGFWRAVSTHTSYDAYWQDQAVDKLLAREPLSVPMKIVAGLFDQEDIYGGPALYKALAPKDPEGRFVHLVLGPWNHGQGRREARALGPMQFEGDTAGWFRWNVMQPFLDHYLKDAPRPDTPRVLAYETGANRWHRLDHWPRACGAGCAEPTRDLYLQGGGRLSFDRAQSGATPYDEYVSDPPSLCRTGSGRRLNYAPDSTWGEWRWTTSATQPRAPTCSFTRAKR
jgi:predicted acyl esterase